MFKQPMSSQCYCTDNEGSCTVNVILGIMELDLIVLVSKFFIDVSKIFYFFLSLIVC